MLELNKERFKKGEYYSFQITGDQREFVGKVNAVENGKVSFVNAFFIYGEELLPLLRSSTSTSFIINEDKINFEAITDPKLSSSIEESLREQTSGIVAPPDDFKSKFQM